MFTFLISTTLALLQLCTVPIEMVQHWVRQFMERSTEVRNQEQVSTPSEAITDNSVTAVGPTTEKDWCITFPTFLCDLQENRLIEISQGTPHTIIHEHLNLSKLLACWEPKDLIEDHYTKQMGAALHFLFLLPWVWSFFVWLDCYWRDKCWVHFYIPETNTQPMQWLSH